MVVPVCKHSLTTMIATFKVTGNLRSSPLWCSVWTSASHFCYDYIPECNELPPHNWLISYLCYQEMRTKKWSRHKEKLSRNENILPNKVAAVCSLLGLPCAVECKQLLLGKLKGIWNSFFSLHGLNSEIFIIEMRILLLAALHFSKSCIFSPSPQPYGNTWVLCTFHPHNCPSSKMTTPFCWQCSLCISAFNIWFYQKYHLNICAASSAWTTLQRRRMKWNLAGIELVGLSSLKQAGFSGHWV